MDKLLRIAGRLLKVRETLQYRGEWRIYWMEDWTGVWELADAKLVHMRCYGPSTYGHCEFFVHAPFTMPYIVDLGPASGSLDKQLAEVGG